MTIQELNFKLMKVASFNAFDGDQVVNCLKANPDLWESAYMTRFDLIPLRDMKQENWNIDTLYIIPKTGKHIELFNLASGWSADEVDWLNKTEAQHLLGSSAPSQVLRVWWD